MPCRLHRLLTNACSRLAPLLSQEIFFNFSAPFEIHDDSETLKRMHMQRCPSERLAALVPPNLVQFARGLDVVTDAPATTAGARSASGRR